MENTKEITLPSGKIAVAKTNLTVRDRLKIRNAYLKGIKIDISKIQAGSDDISGLEQEISAVDLIEADQNALIEILLVSYDGSAEKIADRILDEGSYEDYTALIEELKKIKTGDFPQTK